MERKLASIEKILEIKPALNSDNLELAKIKGWQCVVKKNDFKVGDYCVYIEIDSVLPEKVEFEFMRERKFRIKTIKLRSNISQGICFNLNILPLGTSIDEGKDVTEILDIRKYEIPIPSHLSGDVKGAFPVFLNKSDAERIQNIPEIINTWKDLDFYASEKLDGTSATFYILNGGFGVCSRNLELKETDNNTYWQIAKKYNIEKILKSLNRNIAIQGEIIGQSIQKNKYDLPNKEYKLFNAYDIDSGVYFTLEEFKELAKILGILTVPILATRKLKEFGNSIDDFINYSIGNSVINTKAKREGIVFSSVDNSYKIFKIVNPEFLLKYNE